MNKYIILCLIFNSHLVFGDDLGQLYSLSNQAMDVVTQTNEFPSDGHFRLTAQQADLVSLVGKNDFLIGERLGSQDKNKVDCKENDESFEPIKEEFDKRKFRVGAIEIYSWDDFNKNERFSYTRSPYEAFMYDHDIATDSSSRYDWKRLLKRAKYNEGMDLNENTKKIVSLIKKETGLDITTGAVTSELLYQNLLDKPSDWKAILSKNKDALSFDEKVQLVAKLGEDFGNDYNYKRNKEGLKKGIIPIETMLKNLSNSESGGICRDVALAQTQMLGALGVNEAYSVGYISNSGGHATMLAVDPNDKNKIYKFNYGEMYSDRASKGAAALDQDNSLPNIGMNYRVYDKDGKPLAVVPTEIGNMLREVTDQSKKPGEESRSYSLLKAYFNTDKTGGSFFSGTTSTGETITGVAFTGKMDLKNIDIKAGVVGYKARANKLYYDIDETGFYAFDETNLKTVLYEGNYGKFDAGVGTKIEIIKVNAKSMDKVYDDISRVSAIDSNVSFNAKANYSKELDKNNSISFGTQVNARIDKSNIADEGSRKLQYDSTVLISKYDHAIADDLKSSLEMATTFNKYGNNLTLKASLKDESQTFNVGSNVPVGKRAPAFFSGQEKNFRFAYEKATKSGWNFELEYEQNLDAKTKNVNRDF